MLFALAPTQIDIDCRTPRHVPGYLRLNAEMILRTILGAGFVASAGQASIAPSLQGNFDTMTGTFSRVALDRMELFLSYTDITFLIFTARLNC